MSESNLVTLDDADAALARESCLSTALRRADRAIMQLYDEALRPSGLRVTQFSLLMAIRSLEPVRQNELARRTIMEKTTLTRNLAPLARLGLVRIDAGADRRVKELSLTPQGHRLLAQAFPLWRQAQRKAERRLGKGAVVELVADLTAAVHTIGNP